MLKGYADEHVVMLLTEALRQRGMDVVRVQDIGHEGTKDSSLLDEALADERVMLTNDKDFLRLAAKRTARHETFAPIFFWPQQQRTVGQLIRSIIREASLNEYKDICSQVFYL